MPVRIPFAAAYRCAMSRPRWMCRGVVAAVAAGVAGTARRVVLMSAAVANRLITTGIVSHRKSLRA
jgi:hypothetical protein